MKVRQVEFPDYVMLRSIQYNAQGGYTSREAISRAIADFHRVCKREEQITLPPDWDYVKALNYIRKRILDRINKGKESELSAFAYQMGIVCEDTTYDGRVLPKKILEEYDKEQVETFSAHSDQCASDGWNPDKCLGRLPGVSSACCGHGKDLGYITFENGIMVQGFFIIRKIR